MSSSTLQYRVLFCCCCCCWCLLYSVFFRGSVGGKSADFVVYNLVMFSIGRRRRWERAFGPSAASLWTSWPCWDRYPGSRTFCRRWCPPNVQRRPRWWPIGSVNKFRCLSVHLTTYLDVDVLLGWSFEKLQAELVSQLLTPLVGDDALVFHVAFVSDQDDLSVIPRISLDLGAPAEQKCVIQTSKQNKKRKNNSPVLNAVERFFVGDVVHQQESHSSAVVSCRDRPVPFLPCRVLFRCKPKCWMLWQQKQKFNRDRRLLPRSEVWPACLDGRRSWLWNRFRRLKRRPMWRSHRRNERGMMSCRRCCCRWSTAWTCNQNSDRPHPSATGCLGLPTFRSCSCGRSIVLL